MNTELATRNDESMVIENLIVNGDLSKLSSQDRVTYYRARCDAAGLDYRTSPFMYVTLQGKLTLYATKTATEQLCEKRGLSCEIVRDEFLNDLYRVHARVHGKDGRKTDNIGVVTVGTAKGDQLANAMMKAVTKAYRRAVLSHCGMGILDESEIETIPGAVLAQFEQNGNGHHVETDPAPALVTEADLKAYEERRDYAATIGLTPPGTLSLNSTRAKWQTRMDFVEKMIKDAEAKESPEPPAEKVADDVVEAETVAEAIA